MLNSEQAQCLEAAGRRQFHHFMAKQAQGNLKVILEICRQFYRCDKKFQVVCSTGIAR